jgi:hypothetical protein
MTAIELRDLLVTYCARHPSEAAEQEVVIETAQGRIPCHYMSAVISAGSGSDWTKYCFVLRADDRLVVENFGRGKS